MAAPFCRPAYRQMPRTVVWMALQGSPEQTQALLAALWQLAFVGPVLEFEPVPTLSPQSSSVSWSPAPVGVYRSLR